MTFTNWEIVFWDNQSTDRSALLVSQRKDPRIHYYYAPEHTVLGEARNLAIAQANGDWVAFLDCDDLWFPEKLALQVNLIKQYGADLGLVYSRTECLLEKEGRETKWGRKLATSSRLSKKPYLPQGDIFTDMLCANYVPLVSALVRRSALTKIGGLNPHFKQAEDYELFVKISRTHAVAAVDAITCQFRVHNNNWSHSQAEISYTESIAIVEQYLPNPAAQNGAALWRAKYAGYLISKFRVNEAIVEIVKSGKYGYIFFQAFAKVFRINLK